VSSAETKSKAGLEDVVATSSALCFLDGDRGVLAYRGYDIHDLARFATFEEVCYLLWHGRLPGRAELGDLQSQLAVARPLPESILRLMKMLPPADGMDALREHHGERCARVKACFSMRGGLNGGTAASMFNALDEGVQAQLDDPFLLNPAGSAPADTARHRDPAGALLDADFKAWLAPFVMGPINTRVVRRSAALQADNGLYAPDFHYQEYQHIGRGAPGALAATLVAVGMAAGRTALGFEPIRRIAERLVPAPGEGPSKRTMARGSFRCELIGVGERGTVQRARIAGRGDPGNRATTVFVCEAALALVRDARRLPSGVARGGVLTPSVAFGKVLAQRLRSAGMTLQPDDV
jgi:short subunit dehydrogenase-like uncharacterized protein